MKKKEKNTSIYRERFRGYQATLMNNGITFDEKLVIESHLPLEDGNKCVRVLLDRVVKLYANFSASDYVTVGTLQELKKTEIKGSAAR